MLSLFTCALPYYATTWLPYSLECSLSLVLHETTGIFSSLRLGRRYIILIPVRLEVTHRHQRDGGVLVLRVVLLFTATKEPQQQKIKKIIDPPPSSVLLIVVLAVSCEKQIFDVRRSSRKE